MNSSNLVTLPDQVDLFTKSLAAMLPNFNDLAMSIWQFFILNLFYFKLAGALMAILFLFLAIYFAIISNFIDSRTRKVVGILDLNKINEKKIEKSWRKVKKLMEYGDEAHFNMAIISADNILDDVLKKSGFEGENLGEKLKNINSKQLPEYDKVWEAHKIRNKIAHESDFKIEHDTAVEVISIYEKVFKELGLIE
jgi:hypothetical protein